MAEVITAIGWVLSPMIKKMVGEIPSYIMGQYHWQRDTQRDLEKLQAALLRIQVVVEKAEGWQTMKDSQKQLLQQLKDAVYEADDLLDEFEYQKMKAQAKELEGKVSRAASSSLKFGKRLVGRDKLCAKLTEILQKLDDVNKNADRLIQVAGLEKTTAIEQVDINSGRVTGSISTEMKIFGRDKEKDKIVSLLLKMPDELGSSCTNISIIPIIGDGGVGKTTLTQIVYNDHRIKDQFQLRMWICVSDSFDEIRLTREMLECVSEPNEKHEGIINFNMLQNKLQTKLNSKKFLLVLDDVWIEEKKGKVLNREMWKKLLAPLRDGERDSKILVTTRMKIVAEIFEIFGAMNPISLEGLPEDETWSLLKECAFGNENPDNHPELQRIGKQIAKRLSGSPLASKLVGSMLRDRLDAQKWMEILDRKMFDDVMSILRLSFQRLPDHLKPCFAYCSIFPKDWRFEPKKLVLLWIAQGYIQPSMQNERQMVDVGMDYFNELLSRSFFQKIEQRSYIHYVIHDFIHDLAQSVSMDECFRVDCGKQMAIMQPIHHLGVAISNEDEIREFATQLEKMSNLKDLRTLIFCSKWQVNCTDFPPSMFKGLRSLRALDFSGLRMDDFPQGISDLTHLRYLILGVKFFQILPESLCELYHLQVLASPGELSVSGSIMQLNKFGKLTWLEAPELKLQIEKEKGNHMGELKDMKVVAERVHINSLENATTKKRALEGLMLSSNCTDELRLEWDGRSSGHKADKGLDVEVLEGLQPHPNLRQLELVGYRGVRSPRWLEMRWLINLQTVLFTDCWNLEALPPLGHLPLLKELKIRGMHAMKQVGREFYGAADDSYGVRGFPSLEVLVFEEMPEWSEWCGAEFLVFPRLRKLRIKKCPKLLSFPLFPLALREIDIDHTGSITCLELRPLSSSSFRKRFAVTSSVIPCHRTLLHNHILAAIEKLYIRDCNEPMLDGQLLGLVYIKELRIDDCRELSWSGRPNEDEEDGSCVLPSSLKLLEITNCGVTDGWLSRCLQGLTSLSELKIQGCTGLTSLPSAQVWHLLTALQVLNICDCEQLTSPGGFHALLPSTLRAIVICNTRMIYKLKLRTLSSSSSSKRFVLESSVIPSRALLHEHLLASIKELHVIACKEPMPDGGLLGLVNLKKLQIVDCQELLASGIPDEDEEEEDGSGILPSSLKILVINGCCATNRWLRRCLQGLTSLSKLKIWKCTGLMALPSAHALQHLTTLQKLEVKHCKELISLGGLHGLTSLRHLQVAYCPNMNSLPEEGLPFSVEYLYLQKCDPALIWRVQENKGLEWDKLAHISHVYTS